MTRAARKQQNEFRRKILINRLWLAAAIAVLLIVPSAFAGNTLIQDFPWGTNVPNETDMSAVFGSNYTEYNYTVAPSTVFVHSNLFVFMEGGDGTQTEFENYLTANSATILIGFRGAASYCYRKLAGTLQAPTLSVRGRSLWTMATL
jgi:hypothetical protein